MLFVVTLMEKGNKILLKKKVSYVNFKYLNEEQILTTTVYHSNDAPLE